MVLIGKYNSNAHLGPLSILSKNPDGWHSDTLLGVTDGVSGRKNGLVRGIFHALHDEIKIKSREPVGHFQFRPVQSSTDLNELRDMTNDIRRCYKKIQKKLDICTGKTEMEFTGSIFLNHSLDPIVCMSRA